MFLKISVINNDNCIHKVIKCYPSTTAKVARAAKVRMRNFCFATNMHNIGSFIDAFSVTCKAINYWYRG